MLALATKVTLRRNTSWTGHIVRRSGDMTLVAWTTGPLAGESKWHDTANLATRDDLELSRKVRSESEGGNGYPRNANGYRNSEMDVLEEIYDI